MARPLRVEYEGALYHITSRGNAGQDIFMGDGDRRAFLEILEEVVGRFAWHCHAYCLMPNHYHLLVETGAPTLSRGMRHLNGVYTQWFNRRHGRTGHVFQGRFKAILVEKESHLLEVARYVALNPVRAGLARDPGDWAWSSYRATAGEALRPVYLSVDWILSQFDAHPGQAAAAYRAFVERGREVDIWSDLRGGIFLGSDEFIARLRPGIVGRAGVREIPRAQRSAGRPPLTSLFAGAGDKASRDQQIHEAVRVHGYTLREVADFLGLYYTTVSVIAKRVAEARRHQ